MPKPFIDLDAVYPSKKTQAEKKQKALEEKLASKNAGWHAKQTDHTYLTLDQKKAMLGVTPDRAFLREIKQEGGQAQGWLPSYDPEVDWRTKNGGKVSPVKDQGTCGSCVSFATVGLIELIALIEKGILLDLSEADQHFCSVHGPNCNGWFPPAALELARSRGSPMRCVSRMPRLLMARPPSACWPPTGPSTSLPSRRGARRSLTLTARTT